eukprot:gnl/TRDRNA2_/TRDRNA2_179664_c0_seq1.p1 gnl/TRDRNA2_/TRDRNA2_179664_c0~~gnl/TRDRNA2_/TRDRNA2_179664_c0_seq1.p1  ORF type:complete len:557 (+),score=82.90 gnl/TRDRNA2_/TRDRNA2_179664_c0_seq1:60-1673(+)
MSIFAAGRLRSPDAGRLAAEDKASSEERDSREAAAKDDLCCFVSLCGPEDGAVLGLGLHVHLRTPRQVKTRMPPELDLVLDYVDVDAFNEGVQHAAAARAAGASRWPGDQRQFEDEEHWPSMTSSSRRPLSGWLPLYVNTRHWAAASRYAPAAFALLAHGRSDARFQPEDALNVCCRLLSCAVVGFTAGQSVLRASEDPRAAARGKASARAVQMYGDAHRLLLQMAQEYPALRREASRRLTNFIRSPAGRTREQAPCLGHLVHCLLVVDEITWADLAPTLVPEALRRHVLRSEQRGRCFDSRACNTSSMEELIWAWDCFAPQACMVLSSCIMFYHRIGKPHGQSLQDVMDAYDRRWGRLPQSVVEDIISECDVLCQKLSVVDFVLPLMISSSFCIEDVCELLLWAEKFGRWRGSNVIPEEHWPTVFLKHGTGPPRPLLGQWLENRNSPGTWGWQQFRQLQELRMLDLGEEEEEVPAWNAQQELHRHCRHLQALEWLWYMQYQLETVQHQRAQVPFADNWEVPWEAGETMQLVYSTAW